MAVYKVPQDVEAEDKLIGPFGFRQFIYLLIVAFACFVAYMLSRVFVGLILIPLPFIVFFAALALPLRKDQPTEVYLAALLQYNLKSKRRMWKPDGIVSTVEILAPRKVEDHRTKDITEDEAMSQFEQLAQIMDTRGWAGRGVVNPQVNSTNMKLSDAVVKEAADTHDILSADSSGAQSFDTLLQEQKKISRQEAEQLMKQASTDLADQAIVRSNAPIAVTPPSVGALPQPQLESEADKALLSQAKPNKYPISIHQQIIQPLSAQTKIQPASSPLETVSPILPTPSAPPLQSPPQSTSSEPPLAAIIKPEDDPGLSIATIAAEARRRSQQTAEVVIKLH